MSDTIPETRKRPALGASLQVLSISALGVVFGNIGTSPLNSFNGDVSVPCTAVRLPRGHGGSHEISDHLEGKVESLRPILFK
jgi:hypothetical protein